MDALNIATTRIGPGTVPIACEQRWQRSVNGAATSMAAAVTGCRGSDA
jgi:hypothetical protein